MTKSSIEVKVDHNTEKIKVLEDRVDKNEKKLDETISDVQVIKKGMNTLIENDKKIAAGIEKIDKKIPEPWFKRIKFWQILSLLFVFLVVIGMLS